MRREVPFLLLRTRGLMGTLLLPATPARRSRLGPLGQPQLSWSPQATWPHRGCWAPPLVAAAESPAPDCSERRRQAFSPLASLLPPSRGHSRAAGGGSAGRGCWTWGLRGLLMPRGAQTASGLGWPPTHTAAGLGRRSWGGRGGEAVAGRPGPGSGQGRAGAREAPRPGQALQPPLLCPDTWPERPPWVTWSPLAGEGSWWFLCGPAGRPSPEEQLAFKVSGVAASASQLLLVRVPVVEVPLG